jgi:hypothetical protein
MFPQIGRDLVIAFRTEERHSSKQPQAIHDRSLLLLELCPGYVEVVLSRIMLSIAFLRLEVSCGTWIFKIAALVSLRIADSHLHFRKPCRRLAAV